MYFKDTVNGIEIDCDSSISYISFKADWMETPDGWFFQGDDADYVIKDIKQYAYKHGISEQDAAAWWCEMYLY